MGERRVQLPATPSSRLYYKGMAEPKRTILHCRMIHILKPVQAIGLENIF